MKTLNTKAEFDAFLKEHASKLVVVDFYADWCGPCKAIAPKLEEFSQTYTTVAFAKVNVDENSETSEAVGVEAMPTFLFYNKGAKVAVVVGANAAKIEEIIKEHM